MVRLPLLWMLLACLVWPARAESEVSANCGSDDAPCTVALGNYVVRLPNAASEAPRPALFWFHGYGRSGPLAMKNTGVVDAFLKRGYAVIAPTGLARPNRTARAWSFHPERPAQRDEGAFARQVLTDAAMRFGIDRERVLMSGFSIGGSQVWYLACADPTIAAAYAPVAGAFWRPHPRMDACAAPVRLFHTHGWRDGTVPLEGRVLGGGAILQGDVFYSLQIMRNANGCRNMKADAFATDGPFWRRRWTRCADGSALEFALHTGGHGVPRGWADMAMDWFERQMASE